MNFTVLVDEGGTTEGAELALYKKTELDTGNYLGYYVYIVYKNQSEAHYTKVPAQRRIDSSCKSWQVFNISSIKDDLPVGVHKFNLLVAVFKETEFNQPLPLPALSCNEIKSLFVMDTFADINTFKGIEVNPESETPTETEELKDDEKGEEKSNEKEKENDTAAAEDNNNETVEMASGSGGGEDLVITTTTTMIPPPPIMEEDKVENFLPTVAIFLRGGPDLLLKKRSASESTKTDIDLNKGVDTTVEEEQVEESDESSGVNCRLLENKVDLQALDPDVLKPSIVDIGKCSNSTDTVECGPTAFRNLEVFRKRSGNITVASIEIRHDYIITECTPFAKTQQSTDDLTSSGSNPLRRKRFIDETPKAEDSETNKGKDAVIETDTDEEDSEESSNANCRLLENKISLSTINPSILVPNIWDIGKCSGSTDTMECRPTGFRPLHVLLKINGALSFNILENFITTECTPFFNFNIQSTPNA